MNVISIYITEPQGDGFGWSVECDECGQRDRMLSESGAEQTAAEHAAEHVLIVREGTT